MPDKSEKSLAAEVATIEGTKVLTQLEILKNATINPAALSAADIAIIRDGCMHKGLENHQYQEIAFFALKTELINNIKDDTGTTRGTEFQLLEQLGLLGDNENLPSSRLLTKKGAALLGIELGGWHMAPEVRNVVANSKQNVASAISTHNQGLDWCSYGAKIINLTPNILVGLPTNMPIRAHIQDLLRFLKSNLATQQGLVTNSPGGKYLMTLYQRLGWIGDVIDENENQPLNIIITPLGMQVLEICEQSI